MGHIEWHHLIAEIVKNHWNLEDFNEDMYYLVVSTVLADGLALLGAKTSAGTGMI